MIKQTYNISFSDLTFEKQESIKEDLKETIKILYPNESRLEAIEQLKDDELPLTKHNIKYKTDLVIDEKVDDLIYKTFIGEGEINEANY